MLQKKNFEKEVKLVNYILDSLNVTSFHSQNQTFLKTLVMF